MQRFLTMPEEAVALLQLFKLEDLIARVGVIQPNEVFDISNEWPITGDAVHAKMAVEAAAADRDLGDRFTPEQLNDMVIRQTAANRVTLYRILIALAGRRDLIFEFGPDTTLDRVSIQTWNLDTCGCEVSAMFHRTKDAPHVPIRSLVKCRAHRHLKGGHEGNARDHHDELLSETRAKNFGVLAIAEALGVNEAEIAWEFEADRSITFKHPKIADAPVGSLGRRDLERQLAKICGKRAARLG